MESISSVSKNALIVSRNKAHGQPLEDAVEQPIEVSYVANILVRWKKSMKNFLEPE